MYFWLVSLLLSILVFVLLVYIFIIIGVILSVINYIKTDALYVFWSLVIAIIFVA